MNLTEAYTERRKSRLSFLTFHSDETLDLRSARSLSLEGKKKKSAHFTDEHTEREDDQRIIILH